MYSAHFLFKKNGLSFHQSRYSRISPGWHCSTLQIASRVENRTAFTFPVLRIDKLTTLMPVSSESSLSCILRWANTTSKFTIIGIISDSKRVF